MEIANQSLQTLSQRNRDEYNACLAQTETVKGECAQRYQTLETEHKNIQAQYAQSKLDILDCNSRFDANNKLREQQENRVKALESENSDLRSRMQRALLCEARMQMHMQQLNDMQKKYADLMTTASMALNDAHNAVPPLATSTAPSDAAPSSLPPVPPLPVDISIPAPPPTSMPPPPISVVETPQTSETPPLPVTPNPAGMAVRW